MFTAGGGAAVPVRGQGGASLALRDVAAFLGGATTSSFGLREEGVSIRTAASEVSRVATGVGVLQVGVEGVVEVASREEGGETSVVTVCPRSMWGSSAADVAGLAVPVTSASAVPGCRGVTAAGSVVCTVSACDPEVM